MNEKFQVYGEITIPIYFPINTTCKQAALDKVSKTINSQNITLIDGNLYTSDNREHVIIAPRCRVKWIEVLSSSDI
jgi:hypothetical protein